MRPEWRGLRDYQQAALAAVAERKVPRAIVALATGAGKGHIAGHMTEALGTDRVLYLVHRDTLVDQLEHHVRRVAPMVGVEQAKRKAGALARTVIASVQTVAAGDCRRLKALAERGFDAVVIDESHHAVAESYCRIQAELGLLEPGPNSRERWRKTSAPPIYHVGLTATPGRGDGIGLHLVYDEIIFRRDLAELVRAGWLVPPIGHRIETSADASQIRSARGDYIDADIERVFGAEDVLGEVYSGWSKVASGLRTVGFAATTDHADALADHFRAHGVSAWSIHGKQSKSEQAQIRTDFEQTPGSVLFSCQLIGEGVDIPSVECVLMTAPTQSSTVYAQRIGRGTRLASGARDYNESVKLGKAACLVLDVTGSMRAVGKRALTIGDLVGLPWPDEADGRDVIELLAEQEERQREQVKIRDRESSIQSVRLLDSRSLPECFGLAWLQAGESFLLPTPDSGIVRLATDTLDRWAAERKTASGWEAFGEAKPKQADAVRAVEHWYRESYPAAVVLSDRRASWRDEPVSDNQAYAARKYRIAVTAEDTRGTVSDKINAAMAALGKTSTWKPRKGPSGPGPCPKCESDTRHRQGKNGGFYGCVKYPECRGTREEVA